MLKRYRGTRERRQKKAEELAEASQYQLMLAQFKKHRVAWVCLYLLALLYIISIFAPFVAPYDKLQRFEEYTYAKPSQVHLIAADGNWHLPFIYGRTRQLDKKTFTYTFTEDPSKRYPIHLFATGEPYQLFGVIPTNRHLLGVEGDQPLFLLGSDKLGRDLFSLEEGLARRIEKELPADGKVGGFDRGAASLFMDDGQLDRYLAVADMVLDEGVFNEPPKVQKLTYDGKNIHQVAAGEAEP